VVVTRGNTEIYKFVAFGLRSLDKTQKDTTMARASCPAAVNTVCECISDGILLR
jgi:hypothetical protein